MFTVPPSGGSLEIGNIHAGELWISPHVVPPSGGSLEIGNSLSTVGCKIPYSSCSPFGGIPRNWKQEIGGR